MRTMIDLGSQRGHLQIMDTPTTVDCGREVRFRRTFRSFVECMVPYCCSFQPHPSDQNDAVSVSSSSSSSSNSEHSSSHNGVVTGTFFGHRRGRVSFCLQDDTRGGSPPLLLVELAVPTAALAREMDQGLVRIALECDRRDSNRNRGSLFQVPAWSMYCNGRKVGFAVRRQVTTTDAAVFRLMQSVSVGAGVLPLRSNGGGDEELGDMLYLRARFERVTGSSDSESFHMINPGGSYGQELSVFLLRS